MKMKSKHHEKAAHHMEKAAHHHEKAKHHMEKSKSDKYPEEKKKPHKKHHKNK